MSRLLVVVRAGWYWAHTRTETYSFAPRLARADRVAGGRLCRRKAMSQAAPRSRRQFAARPRRPPRAPAGPAIRLGGRSVAISSTGSRGVSRQRIAPDELPACIRKRGGRLIFSPRPPGGLSELRRKRFNGSAAMIRDETAEAPDALGRARRWGPGAVGGIVSLRVGTVVGRG